MLLRLLGLEIWLLHAPYVEISKFVHENQVAQAKITVHVRFVNWDTTVTTGVIKILNRYFQGHVFNAIFLCTWHSSAFQITP